MQLPFVWPNTETYQCSSLVEGVIRAHNNISNAYYNNYLNLYCLKANSLWEIGLQFWDVTWEDLRLYGIFEMNLFHINTFDNKSFHKFVMERLTQDNYVLLHYIDEYFLPYSEFYEKTHFIHDAYVLGYEDDQYIVLAYTNKKLQIFRVLQTDIWKALVSCYDYMDEVFFCSLRPNHAIKVNIDYKRMRTYLELYLGKDINTVTFANDNNECMINALQHMPQYDPDYVYGMNCYDFMLDLLRKKKHEEILDIRPFRLLWEHKKMLFERISMIREEYKLVNIDMNPYEGLIKNAYQLFLLAIKYNASMKEALINRIVLQLEEIRNTEAENLPLLLRKWNVD